MRVMVFFDLPVITSANRKDYRDFHKYLIKTGFLMMQESVYCRLAQNSTMAEQLWKISGKISLRMDWYRC